MSRGGAERRHIEHRTAAERGCADASRITKRSPRHTASGRASASDTSLSWLARLDACGIEHGHSSHYIVSTVV